MINIPSSSRLWRTGIQRHDRPAKPAESYDYDITFRCIYTPRVSSVTSVGTPLRVTRPERFQLQRLDPKPRRELTVLHREV